MYSKTSMLQTAGIHHAIQTPLSRILEAQESVSLQKTGFTPPRKSFAKNTNKPDSENRTDFVFCKIICTFAPENRITRMADNGCLSADSCKTSNV
jgi:hypothetical protein